MFDEALAVFSRLIRPVSSIPRPVCFTKPSASSNCSRRPTDLATLDKLLHSTEGVAEPYLRVATLMQSELQSLDDQSLDLISRKMQDSERRLDLGRGGQRAKGPGRDRRIAQRPD